MRVDIEDILSCFKEAGVLVDMGNINFERSLDSQGIDSLDMINVYLRLEDKYSIKLSEEDILKLNTISEIILFIESTSA